MTAILFGKENFAMQNSPSPPNISLSFRANGESRGISLLKIIQISNFKFQISVVSLFRYLVI